MSTYTWKIESVNIDAGTMEVTFTHDTLGAVVLNLPMPAADEDVGAFIDGYAPRTMWSPKSITVTAGMAGAGVVEPTEEAIASEVPNTVGSWQEEYLRAMIYSILEEIQEQTV